MATARDFEVECFDRVRPHEDVERIVLLIECDGEKLVQIDTYGRPGREMPGKLSQTLRLSETAFKKLMTIGNDFF